MRCETNMLDAVGTHVFTYTPAGQLASENGPWANDTVTNAYVQGLRTAMSLSQPSGSWSQSYNYDSMWRMTNITSPAGAFSYVFGGASSASSLIKQISLPNGASITNGFDSLARLTQTALNNKWGHTLDSYAYIPDALGLRTNITRNLGLTSSSVAVGYDNIGQITSWLAKESGGAQRLNEQLGFGYDAAHNLLRRTNNSFVQNFTVDAANELTNVTRAGTFTVSGATPAPATSVTVNGQAAQTYGDFTFARTNLSLANGQNTFTNIAQNTYGLKVTNTFAVNLPTNVNLTFDANGSLTNDGARTLAYDSENQLTNVSVAEQWKSEFVYDGLGRRRIARDYAWQGGAWEETNEVHYIYDGMLLIQERDSNNAPLVTYTRGLDLSGTRQRAGGIGGLLARTDANGSTFYHADALGNITALMDGNENIVARYLYNPFGKLIGQWGPMADANVMQFSSMPQRDGLVFYPFRAYDPNLQRWPNHDPIGERGGLNLYGYVANNPLSYVDPLGTTLVVSDHPFRGQQFVHYSHGQTYMDYGPYTKNFDDGSDKIKFLRKLTPERVADLKKKARDRLKCKAHSKNDRANEHGFDTDIWEGYDPDRRQYYEDENGNVYADNEINYLGIGTYEAWMGDPQFLGEMGVMYYKLTEYGQLPPSYGAGTFYWFEQGYQNFNQ